MSGLALLSLYIYGVSWNFASGKVHCHALSPHSKFLLPMLPVDRRGEDGRTVLSPENAWNPQEEYAMPVLCTLVWRPVLFGGWDSLMMPLVTLSYTPFW